MNLITTLFMVLTVWNLFTFILMGVDKFKAIKKKWRISEKTLFTLSFLFGGVGVICGMSLFRHKTKHWSFRIIVPIGIVTNVIILFYIFSGLSYWQIF